MNQKLLRYTGREQSYIKHLFLTKYMQVAAYKIMQGRSPIFNFVDAFAGPWRIEDDNNYSDASFDQALKTLDSVKSDLASNGLTDLHIRYCFCEKRKKAYTQLQEYARQKTDFDIRVFPGVFEDNLNAISDFLTGGFTFTFIDPTGWDIRNQDVFRFLLNQDGEFLLNFMSDHINRHSGYGVVSKSFERFLAHPDWKADFDALPDDWSNERKVLHLLKCQMQKARVATYLPDFSIMLPHQKRLKMRLVLGTHVTKGLELFRDIQAKVEEEETRIRHNLREDKTVLASLISEEDDVEFEQQGRGVGCNQYRRRAEERIVEVLKEHRDMRYDELWPCIMEDVPMRKTQVNTLIQDMKRRGLVDYNLPQRKRVPQPETQIELTDEGFAIE